MSILCLFILHAYINCDVFVVHQVWICMIKVWCLSVSEWKLSCSFHIYFFPTSVSAHWCYRFFDVQFISDMPIFDVRCVNRPNSRAVPFLWLSVCRWVWMDNAPFLWLCYFVCVCGRWVWMTSVREQWPRCCSVHTVVVLCLSNHALRTVLRWCRHASLATHRQHSLQVPGMTTSVSDSCHVQCSKFSKWYHLCV